MFLLPDQVSIYHLRPLPLLPLRGEEWRGETGPGSPACLRLFLLDCGRVTASLSPPLLEAWGCVLCTPRTGLPALGGAGVWRVRPRLRTVSCLGGCAGFLLSVPSRKWLPLDWLKGRVVADNKPMSEDLWPLTLDDPEAELPVALFCSLPPSPANLSVFRSGLRLRNNCRMQAGGGLLVGAELQCHREPLGAFFRIRFLFGS